MDLDAALSPGFADARLGLLMFALFDGGSESSRNRLDLSCVAATGTHGQGPASFSAPGRGAERSGKVQIYPPNISH